MPNDHNIIQTALMHRRVFNDIVFVSDGRVCKGDITVEDDLITHIRSTDEIPADGLSAAAISRMSDSGLVLLPGVIDTHVHTREPGLTHKGDLATETRAAAAGGVTSVMDMPNVVPQTTSLDALRERFDIGSSHAFVNYSFLFGATNTNAALLAQLDPVLVPAVKLFMGSSTGGMLVDHGEALHDVFRLSTLPIVAHCEDTAIINDNMLRARAEYGDDPSVEHHSEIRSREACIRSSRMAAELAHRYGCHLHIAHVSTADELSLTAEPTPERHSRITLEACLPHILFCDEDYQRLQTRIKCNPAVKTRADREALRCALTDGRISTIATDHAPHLLVEKTGGCVRAASGIPMVQFSLVAMLDLVEEGLLSLPRLVELMCHAPARLFEISGRGYIREGMKADIVLVCRDPWTMTASDIVSRCGWSPLEGHSFSWRVCQTFCNGHLIYDAGHLATDNAHARRLVFDRGGKC